ncbi:MAG TPA: hypothetical protein VKR53_11560, partial [Puia sp.]|nr:hypothetical protein [Puia sp.]
MQVLKFGGTSVANAENINKVTAIIKRKIHQDKIVVVVSALGGITDTLLNCGVLAAAGDETYKEQLHQAESRHIETVRSLVPITQQSSILSFVKKSCNEMEDMCNGVFMVGELSDKSKDKIMSYGELLSSQIIAAYFSAIGMDCTWKDSRELIRTDSHFGYAAVDFHTTNKNIQDFFSTAKNALFIVPGFI